MKVHELLNYINKKRYKVVFAQTNNVLSNGYFKQNEIDLTILDCEVKRYDVYKTFKTIYITIKGGEL